MNFSASLPNTSRFGHAFFYKTKPSTADVDASIDAEKDATYPKHTGKVQKIVFKLPTPLPDARDFQDRSNIFFKTPEMEFPLYLKPEAVGAQFIAITSLDPQLFKEAEIIKTNNGSAILDSEGRVADLLQSIDGAHLLAPPKKEEEEEHHHLSVDA